MTTAKDAMTLPAMRSDARRNRDKVLSAARAAFAEQGSALQMDDVAKAAGVGVATVYRAFSSKDALLGALAADSFTACLDEADKALARDDTAAAVDQFLHRIADMFAEQAGLRELLADLSPAQRPSRQAQLVDRFTQLHTRAIADHAIRPDISAQEFQAVICAISTAVGQGAKPDLIVDIIGRGLRSPDTAPQ